MLGAVLVCAGGIYFLIQPKFFVYTDLTPKEVNLLKPKSRELLVPLRQRPITITSYINIFNSGRDGVNYGGRIYIETNTFGKYVLEFPQIDFQYKFFYSEEKIDQLLSFSTIPGITEDTPIEEALAIQSKKSGIPVEEIKTLSEYGLDEDIISKYILEDPVVILSTGDQHMPLTLQYNDNLRQATENEITTAFGRLIGMELPVGYVTGHKERTYTNSIDDSGLSKMFSVLSERMAFINQGMPTTSVQLKQPIDKSIEVLVIANPKTNFSEQEIKHFSDFIAWGGNALILSEPNQESIINPLLKVIGLNQKPGELENDDPNLEKHYVFAELKGALYDEASYNSPLLFTPGAAALEISEEKDFIYTSVASYENETVAFTLERKVNGQKQRILVTGDTDMISDAHRLPIAPGGNKVANVMMGAKIASYLTDGVLPLNISRRNAADDIRTTIPYESLSYLWIFMYLIFPGIFMSAGLVTIIRRSKR